MKLYEQVAAELSLRIEQGYYRSGDRLPSIRALSKEHGVSIATVQEAYRLLEDQGLAQPRPKSGYYVRQHKATAQMPQVCRPAQRPLEVSHWEHVLDLLCSSDDPDILAMGRGIPDIQATSLKPLQRALCEGKRGDGLRAFTYDSLRGAPELRLQVARLTIDSGCQLHPDDIVITTGCQEALSTSMRAVTQPGDVVAVDSPSFYGSMQAIKAFGLKAMEIPTDPVKGISLEALELALEQWPIRVIQLTPTCNNPLGYTMPEAHRRQLVLLAQRFDVAIIEDDIYGDLSFAFPRPKTIKSFDNDGRVLLCSSFSKTLAPGLKAGFIEPGRWRERIRTLKFVSSGGNAEIVELTLAELLESGGYERSLRQLRRRCEQQVDAARGVIAENFPRGTKVTRPTGGFILWVELPKGGDSIALFEKLLERGISIAPGPMFSATQRYRNCLRVSVGHLWTERTEKALAEVGRLARLQIGEGATANA